MSKLIALYIVTAIVCVFFGIVLVKLVGMNYEEAGCLAGCLGACVAMFFEDFLKPKGKD